MSAPFRYQIVEWRRRTIRYLNPRRYTVTEIVYSRFLTNKRESASFSIMFAQELFEFRIPAQAGQDVLLNAIDFVHVTKHSSKLTVKLSRF